MGTCASRSSRFFSGAVFSFWFSSAFTFSQPSRVFEPRGCLSGIDILKNVKQPAPANFAGMKYCAGVGGKAIDERAGLPRWRRFVNRHVDHYGSTDDIGAGDAAGEARVERIAAIVAHHEKAVRGNGVRKDAVLPGKRTAKENGLAGIG